MASITLGPQSYPFINGIRYEFSSIALQIAGASLPIIGVKAIDYEDELEPGLVKGTTAQIMGRTRGDYKTTASLEMYMYESYQLIELLISRGSTLLTNQGPGGNIAAPGYMEVPFGVSVSFGDYGQPTITDLVKGARIKKRTFSGKEGAEPLTVKFDLSIMSVWPNGRPPVGAFVP